MKPIIFLASAREMVDTHPLRSLTNEIDGMWSALSEACNQGLCELLIVQNASINDIFEIFLHDKYKDRIRIFHFTGHVNSYQGLVISSTGYGITKMDSIVQLLSQLDNLELVFLNGCSTSSQARLLLEAKIPMVIATSQNITDTAASNFAIRFYDEIAKGETLEKSFYQAYKYMENKPIVDFLEQRGALKGPEIKSLYGFYYSQDNEESQAARNFSLMDPNPEIESKSKERLISLKNKYLAKDKMDDLIEVLLKEVKEDSIRDEIILLSAQFEEFKRKEYLGLGENLEAKNRIKTGFLVILNKLIRNDQSD